MSAPSYPIDTLAEMAAIPEDALLRLIAELPMILAEVRRLNGIMAVFNGVFEGALAMQTPSGAMWTDDDKGESTITVSMPDGDTVAVARKMGDAA